MSFHTLSRAQIEKLLRDAGSKQTPEEYLQNPEIQRESQTAANYAKRAKAAYWSRFWLLTSAAVSAIGLSKGPNIEDFLSVVLLGGMTIIEFKVHTWFQEVNPLAPIWGYRNQCLFAILFVIYGAYHVTHPTPLKELEDLGMGSLQGAIADIERLTYAIIGLGGALGQYILARYYRSANPKAIASTP